MAATPLKAPEAGPPDPLLKHLHDEMQAVLGSMSCTKKTAVRLTIANAIKSNLLASGDYLPPELVLAKHLGVSLGTVQGALKQLQDLGTLIRRRGDGTRVAGHEPLTDEVWHFRFLSREDQAPLRLLVEDVAVSALQEPGFWSDFLDRPAECTRIFRRMKATNGAACGAEMFLAGAPETDLGLTDPSELKMINLRPFLEITLGLKITSRDHTVKLVDPTDPDRDRFGLTAKGPHYEIHARTRSSLQQPVYYQRILIAAAECDLNF